MNDNYVIKTTDDQYFGGWDRLGQITIKEEKDRDRSIKSLEDRQEKTDRKIDTILEKLNELFTPSKRNP